MTARSCCPRCHTMTSSELTSRLHSGVSMSRSGIIQCMFRSVLGIRMVFLEQSFSPLPLLFLPIQPSHFSLPSLSVRYIECVTPCPQRVSTRLGGVVAGMGGGQFGSSLVHPKYFMVLSFLLRFSSHVSAHPSLIRQSISRDTQALPRHDKHYHGCSFVHDDEGRRGLFASLQEVQCGLVRCGEFLARRPCD